MVRMICGKEGATEENELDELDELLDESDEELDDPEEEEE
jgi:hypothetical protein